ncbi:unnamed protein product [Parnassius apollo]|uniref:(apollo) hypothetical protein n=1 Tax=Parnassius apollo TaxID=110799 RepID=A0A8S3XEV7_PARAO|nr:unnamed protein product [Parnassius apollo]
MSRKRSRSPSRDIKRRSRSPRKSEKELLDENILSEISKLPEPNELWDNQFQEGGFSGNAVAPPPPQFSQDGTYPSNYQPSYSGVYDDFSSIPSAPHPPNVSGWNQVPMRPAASAQPAFVNNVEDQIKKEAAIESEMRHQKAALSKQREDCIKKASILKKELETLKEQRNELHSDPKRSPSPDTKRFLKENTKLQLEIQNKLKTINNVVDMLNGLIGEEAQVEIKDADDSTERSSKRKSRSPSGKKFNYVYYDPEMHWCRVCNEFPATAKDYLTHLHSPGHHKMAAAHMEAPWHSVSGMNEGFPNYPSAPTKRTPIRGLQFFVPSTAWYCKLCDQFIGDLHCASAHLKSIVHSKNYTNFVEQNPHWDTDWMSDRQKAFEKSRGKAKMEEKPQYTAHTITFCKDGFHTKTLKDSPPPTSSTEKKRKKEKKKKKAKKKRVASSDSNSSSSSSDSDSKKPKKKKDKLIDDKALSEWMSAIPMNSLNYNERKLLDSLKNRADREDERRKSHTREERDRHEDRRKEERREEKRDVRQNRREDRREEMSERREERLERREERPDRREERPDRREERPERREERPERREERLDRREDRAERKEERTERRDEREDKRQERRNESRSRLTQESSDAKKPEIKKMPFIGKMPVFKNLGKKDNTKNEDQKKEDEKKKQEEEESNKKRREEMDAEIQKKVAEFKEKIAKAQLEKEQQDMAPSLALSAQLGFLPPPQLITPPVPSVPSAPPVAPQQTPNNLPKDFQDALDIIFPSSVSSKPAEMQQQDMFMPGLAGFPVVPPFAHLGLVQPPVSPLMMGFDLNAQLFPHPQRPQLYDTHVPVVPNNHKRNNKVNQKNQKSKQADPTSKEKSEEKQEAKHEPKQKNKEELDELAMLGIDASDVGAGM